MRLYPKKLNSVKELEREKRLLQLAKDKLEDEELFSVKGLKEEVSGDWKESLLANLGTFAEFIPVSGLGADVLKKLAGRILRRKRKERQTEEDAHEEKSGGGILKTIAIEILGGYLKWKAIELTCKGIMRLIRSRTRDKKA